MERLGFFSEKLMDGMAKSGLSRKMTAVRIGCSYEYVRKMSRSESLPSSELLVKLCSIFGWQVRTIEKLIRLDESRRKFGPTFWTVLGRNPRCEALYILWPYLDSGEQQLLVRLMRAYVEERKKMRNWCSPE